METEPILLKSIEERELGAVIDWFYHRKNTFYKLAWTYLENPQFIEEVFYKTILKVFDDFHHVKKNQDFESAVTYLFISECRDLSIKYQEKRFQASEEENVVQTKPKIVNGLRKLEDTYKVFLTLTLICELTHEQVANILHVTTQSVKAQIFKGIQTLNEGMVDNNEGCEGYQNKYIDYLGRTLDRAKKIELEIHLHTCQRCQDALSTLQNVIHSLTRVFDALEIPSVIMDNVKDKLYETESERKRVKRKRATYGGIIAGFFTLLIITGFVTNSYSYLYYSWLELRKLEDEHLLQYLKNGLGEPLNLEKVSNGVKVTIKSAIADEYQTLIYYEVEDITGPNQYKINPHGGFKIENEKEVLQYFPSYTLAPTQSNLYKKEKHIYIGTISLLPIKEERATINLSLSTLQKIISDSINSEASSLETSDQTEIIEGDWTFEIPVTRQPSIEHELEMKTEIEGIPIVFQKLIIAPTNQLLHRFILKNSKW
ncbi:DUF4179 domain-containing protein [Fredinandcohnia humi]